MTCVTMPLATGVVVLSIAVNEQQKGGVEKKSGDLDPRSPPGVSAPAAVVVPRHPELLQHQHPGQGCTRRDRNIWTICSGFEAPRPFAGQRSGCSMPENEENRHATQLFCSLTK